MDATDGMIGGISEGAVGCALEENLVASWRAFSALEEVEFYEGPEAVRFVSGIEYPLCNDVFRARLAGSDPDGKIEEVMEPVRSRGLPMLWWVAPSSEPHDLGARLERAGFACDEEVSCMAGELSAITAGFETPHAVKVERVSDERSLDAWIAVFSEGFELPGFVAEFFRRCMLAAGLGPGSQMRHYIASHRGRPAGCLSVTLAAGVAGLYNATTLEEMRGRHIGLAMSAVAACEAAESGYRVAVAQAMPMGVLLCRRLGFKEFYMMSPYVLGG